MDRMQVAIAGLDKGKGLLVEPDPNDPNNLELAEIPLELVEQPNNPICRLPSVINEYLIKFTIKINDKFITGKGLIDTGYTISKINEKNIPKRLRKKYKSPRRATLLDGSIGQVYHYLKKLI